MARPKPPEGLVPEPDIPEHPVAHFAYTAWGVLGTMRPAGMGPTCIPWDKVVYYGQVHGLDEEGCKFLWEVVSAADQRYLAYILEKLDTTKKPPATPPSGRPPRASSRT